MTMPNMEGLPTVERLKEVFQYDHTTGLLHRKVGSHVLKRPTGSMARGYLKVSVDDRIIFAHRVVWAMCHGAWTESILDHINGNKSDNRIENLRLATKSQNNRNCGKAARNTSGFKGVYWHKKAEKWYSIGRADGKQKNLGLYKTPEEAYEAYKAFTLTVAGPFARFE